MRKPLATSLAARPLAFWPRWLPRRGEPAGRGGDRPRSQASPSAAEAHPDGRGRACDWLARGRQAGGGRRAQRRAPSPSGLDHPRWLYVLPNGDVLVAETNTPPQPEQTGLMAWIMKTVMGWAGAGVPSPNRITLLRDVDGDGVAETKSTFLSGLNSPFGMALVGDDLYVADTDAVLRFPYREGDAGSRRRERRSPTCRPATTTITGPRTSLRAPTARSFRGGRLEQQCRRERHGGRARPRRDPRRSIPRRRSASLRLGPAQSGRARLRAARAARSGSRSTSATSSAAISSPTT